jgi:GcrA cell cycle regulator
MSRSAVLGKIFRLRLGPAPAGETATRQNPEKPSSLARRRDGREGKPMAKAKPVPRAKSLFELTNECCRWPYRRPGTEKYFFCGVAEADLEGGIPYCARHMKRAYLVPPRIAAQPPRKSFRAA